MKSRRSLGWLVLGILAFLLLIGPFLIPIPPLEGAPPAALADADSQFLELQGLRIHYKQAGTGKPLVLLLHGFLGSTHSWRAVLEPLGGVGTVVTFDRPGFGLTERPLAFDPDQSPYAPEAQVGLVFGLMEALGAESAILIGNSAGGALAAYLAVENPARVDKLVLVDAAIFSGGGTPAWIRPLLRLPQVDRLGPLVSRSVKYWGAEAARAAWSDPDRMTAAILAEANQYRLVEHWDRALWEFTKASRPLGLETTLADLDIPVLVITGENDRLVPPEESARLAEVLPRAELVVLPDCGHVPHEECPAAFLEAVLPFLAPSESE